MLLLLADLTRTLSTIVTHFSNCSLYYVAGFFCSFIALKLEKHTQDKTKSNSYSSARLTTLKKFFQLMLFASFKAAVRHRLAAAAAAAGRASKRRGALNTGSQLSVAVHCDRNF